MTLTLETADEIRLYEDAKQAGSFDPVSIPKSIPFDRAADICEAARKAAAPVRKHLTDEALRITSGARRTAYGTPENNFERIARFWSAYLQNIGHDVALTAADVSPMMRLMKEARLCESPDHLDSFVDLVGYTLTGAEVNKVKVDENA